jgi:thiamine-monophosphate kinase
VVKTDTIVAGVHFLANEKPELVGARALRVCLSDLAAGGATPFAYQLSLSLTKNWQERWIAGFARGLAPTSAASASCCAAATRRPRRADHRHRHRLRPVPRGRGLAATARGQATSSG